MTLNFKNTLLEIEFYVLSEVILRLRPKRMVYAESVESSETRTFSPKCLLQTVMTSLMRKIQNFTVQRLNIPLLLLLLILQKLTEVRPNTHYC